LRADALKVYGLRPTLPPDASPAIDALARDAILFEDASAHSSWTKPTVISMLTSRYPSQHGVGALDRNLGKETPTLLQLLREAGIITLAVVNNPVFPLDSGVASDFDCFLFLPDHPVRRLVGYKALAKLTGFTVFPPWATGDRVNMEALALLDDVKERDFFLWIHYMETHAPYFDDRGTAHTSSWLSTPEEIRAMRSVYQADVRRLDGHVGQLLEALKKRGVYEQATVILMADHGEEFAEHGGWDHGKTLYEEQLHVPLLIRVPDRNPRRERSLARQIDIAPTILSLMQLPVPGAWEGRNLLQPPAEERPGAIAQRGDVFSYRKQFRGHTLKAILAEGPRARRHGLGAVEAYYLDEDPGEERPVPVKPGVIEEFVGEAKRVRAALESSRQAAPKKTYDKATIDQLRALGYVD
jgi:arylsulfatase A-like enzyme